jgi:hypothetical protein
VRLCVVKGPAADATEAPQPWGLEDRWNEIESVRLLDSFSTKRNYNVNYNNNNNNNHGSTALYGPGPPLASSFRGY